MSSSGLPDSVRRLIATQVDTFDKLEIVVELATTPGQAVDRKYLAAAVSCPLEVFDRSVLDLAQTGLLTITGELVCPSNAEAIRLMEELLRAYRSDGVAVVRALSEVAMARIRGMTAHSFADAFVLRPKRRGDKDG